jgi:hypothetical protein
MAISARKQRNLAGARSTGKARDEQPPSRSLRPWPATVF